MKKSIVALLSLCILAALPLSAQTAGLASTAPAGDAPNASSEAVSAGLKTSGNAPKDSLAAASQPVTASVAATQSVVYRPKLMLVDLDSSQPAAGNTVQKAPRSAVATTGPWFWTVNLALLGASVANVETLHNCVNCTFIPTNLHDRAVLYGIGLPLDAGIAYLGYHLKKNGHRWWYVPAVAFAGVNAGLAAHWAASTK